VCSHLTAFTVCATPSKSIGLTRNETDSVLRKKFFVRFFEMHQTTSADLPQESPSESTPRTRGRKVSLGRSIGDPTKHLNSSDSLAIDEDLPLFSVKLGDLMLLSPKTCSDPFTFEMSSSRGRHVDHESTKRDVSAHGFPLGNNRWDGGAKGFNSLQNPRKHRVDVDPDLLRVPQQSKHV
jgi:hypothetical protein